MENKSESLVKASAKCDSICHPQGVLHQVASQSSANQVKTFFSNLFSTEDWPARWHCGNWTHFHGWLYICSDLAIWIAYFAIPFLLFRIIRNRKDIPFPRILWLFIAFILLCGSSHLIDAVIFWWPAYRLSALIRFLTGVFSLFTVYALYKLLPMIYRLRTLDQLEAEILERKKAEEEIRHQQVLMKATEDLMKRKDEFMSIASHELKTPITTVKASLQVMEKIVSQNESMDSIVPFVQRAARQVDKLTGLVNELLDVTKIQNGKLEFIKTEFNLKQMIVECIEQCQSADGKHEVAIHGRSSLMVYADRNRIEQVICNFITNSFKYSPPGTFVEVSFEAVDDRRTKVSVSDQGIGIPKDKIAHIFERFFRVEGISQHYSGMGLGLYISSEIVKGHNGEIGVRNNRAKGTTFWFII